MIINFIGEENTSALSLKDLQDKFKKAELQDKLINICDDLSNEFISDSESFKKIITGGILTMERKNQDPFKYRNYAKLIMAANEIPKSSDKSEGYYRRFVMIPLNAKFDKSDKDFDPNIADKIKTPEAMSYILNLAINGLIRIRNRGEILDLELTKSELDEYKADNDPIVAFVNYYTLAKIDGQATDYIFECFNEWHEKEFNRKSQYNKSTITKSLKNNYGVISKPCRINGNITRIYVTDTATKKQPFTADTTPQIDEIDPNMPF
jgi:putative DNA primase/helicase